MTQMPFANPANMVSRFSLVMPVQNMELDSKLPPLAEMSVQTLTVHSDAIMELANIGLVSITSSTVMELPLMSAVD